MTGAPGVRWGWGDRRGVQGPARRKAGLNAPDFPLELPQRRDPEKDQLALDWINVIQNEATHF